MSYATAAALQEAVYQALRADSALAGFIGDAVFDELPSGAVPGTYVSLGESDVRDASDKTGQIGDHRFQISVVTSEEGFLVAQAVAAAVSDVLIDGQLDLSRGRIVLLRFLKARARRVQRGQVRRIDLTFRAIVED